MAPECVQPGYHWVEAIVNAELPERGLGARVGIAMQTVISGQAIKLRALAARMRAHAAQTSVEIFRRKFEEVADELEDAARRAEAPYRLAS